MEKLSDVLKKMSDDSVVELGCGICNNEILLQSNHWNTFNRMKDRAFDSWEHFSGCYSYPVPSPNKRLESDLYYSFAACRDTMWSKYSKYGRMRRDLLEHLIKFFEEKGM